MSSVSMALRAKRLVCRDRPASSSCFSLLREPGQPRARRYPSGCPGHPRREREVQRAFFGTGRWVSGDGRRWQEPGAVVRNSGTGTSERRGQRDGGGTFRRLILSPSPVLLSPAMVVVFCCRRCCCCCRPRISEPWLLVS